MTTTRKGLILVTLAVLAWSTAGLFARFLPLDTATVLFWRGLFGTIGTLALMAVLRVPLRMGTAGLAYALVTAVSMIFFISALYLTTVAHVALLTAAVPFLAAGLGWLVLGERPGGTAILAALVAVLGVGIMVGVSADGDWRGDGLAMLMAATMAGMIVLSRRFPGIPALPATALASGLSALLVLPFATLGGLAARDLGLLAAFAMVNQVAGFCLFALGARYLPPVRTALLTALEAPLAPLWVWLVLTETPSGATLLGGALILAAVLGHTAREAR